MNAAFQDRRSSAIKLTTSPSVAWSGRLIVIWCVMWACPYALKRDAATCVGVKRRRACRVPQICCGCIALSSQDVGRIAVGRFHLCRSGCSLVRWARELSGGSGSPLQLFVRPHFLRGVTIMRRMMLLQLLRIRPICERYAAFVTTPPQTGPHKTATLSDVRIRAKSYVSRLTSHEFQVLARTRCPSSPTVVDRTLGRLS